jgi:hypothetical protein
VYITIATVWLNRESNTGVCVRAKKDGELVVKLVRKPLTTHILMVFLLKMLDTWNGKNTSVNRSTAMMATHQKLVPSNTYLGVDTATVVKVFTVTDKGGLM